MANGNKQKIVIIGEGETAEIAYEYFTYDSNYEVVAFSAEKRFMTKETLFGLPIVPFEELERFYDPKIYKAFVAVSYTQLNRVRTRLYKQAKEKGFTFVSYLSSKAFVWRNVEIGENCFIFENNVLQRHVKIGNNVVLWSGNYVGHRSVIGDNCFVSLNAVISGGCQIGDNCFLGANSCIAATTEGIRVAKDCIVGAGAVVIRDTEEGKVYVGNPAKPLLGKTSFDTFNVKKK
jgi:sugar O-acyltransferase (sialic acid O-acetyltransferase NeuD family)